MKNVLGLSLDAIEEELQTVNWVMQDLIAYRDRLQDERTHVKGLQLSRMIIKVSKVDEKYSVALLYMENGSSRIVRSRIGKNKGNMAEYLGNLQAEYIGVPTSGEL